MGHKYIFLAAVHFLSDLNRREKNSNGCSLFFSLVLVQSCIPTNITTEFTKPLISVLTLLINTLAAHTIILPLLNVTGDVELCRRFLAFLSFIMTSSLHLVVKALFVNS